MYNNSEVLSKASSAAVEVSTYKTFSIWEMPSTGSQCFRINTDKSSLLTCKVLERSERGSWSTSKINSSTDEHKSCCTSSLLVINSSLSSYAEGKASQQLIPKSHVHNVESDTKKRQSLQSMNSTIPAWLGVSEKANFVFKLCSYDVTTLQKYSVLYSVKIWLHYPTTKETVTAWLLITVGVLTATVNLKCPSCTAVFDCITEIRVWIIHTSIYSKLHPQSQITKDFLLEKNTLDPKKSFYQFFPCLLEWKTGDP